MKRLVLGAVALFASAAQAAPEKSVAYDIIEDLTTEIGPRLAGSEAEARARAWAVKRLKAMGFANVRVEEFPLPVWERGVETAEIVSPFPQKLALTALGNSGATPPGGLTAEIAYFPTFADLEAAPERDVRGKIAFVSHSMTRTQDGSQYGPGGIPRRQGPALASRKGAVAIVIRSAGTDRERHPHTGGTSFPQGVTPIPAAALSTLDAEQLERILDRSKRVTMKLVLTPRQTGMGTSGNVIAEVPGRDPRAGLVVLGGHLDSWDLGTGAFDDAAGVAITAAAAKAIMDKGRAPRRTIRLVWWGSEEVGLFGGSAYFQKHRQEPHALAAESDFGADRVWRVDFRLPDSAKPLADRIAVALAPLDIARGTQPAGGGPDIGELVGAGVNAIDLQQDGTRYFDLHHTPNDTLDKIDPAQLDQNVAAWTIMLDAVANAPEDLLAGPK